MRNANERGSALLLCLIILVVVVGISGAYLSFSLINTKKTNDDIFALQALYIAESGANLELHRLNASGGAPSPLEDPVAVNGGEYTIPEVLFYGNDGVDNNGDGVMDVEDEFEQQFYRVVFEGRFTGTTRRLEIVLSSVAGGVFWHTIFAGNRSEDPLYTLKFGGASADNHDLVHGDVYSGGSIETGGYASFLNENGEQTPKPNATHAYDSTDSSVNNVDPVFTEGHRPGLEIPPGVADPSISLYEESALAGDPRYVNVAAELSSAKASPGYILGEQEGVGSYGDNPDGSQHGGEQLRPGDSDLGARCDP